MEGFNYLAILAASIAPILLGFIWYNPKCFGNVWMREAEMTEAKINAGNMAIIFGVSLLLSILLASFIPFLVVHDVGIYGITGGQMDGATTQAFLAEWGGSYRTFGHGAAHGAMAGIFFALPVLAINALFERKSWKYILINVTYWVLCLTIMGSIIAGWK